MTPEEYIQNRVDHQIRWYSQKSGQAKAWYKRLHTVEVTVAALIPVFAGIWDDTGVVAAMGALVAILAAILGLNRFQETWIKYRTICEALKHEKFYYLTRVPPYDNQNAFSFFVRQIEGLISKEHKDWAHSAMNPPAATGADTGMGAE